MVAPVAVGADPDLEERRLALDDGPRGRRGERLDPRPRPDEREPECELDLPFPAVPSPWTNPSHSAAICASLMPGSMISLQCSIAAAAISFASRMRSISCSVLSARASRGAVSRPRRSPNAVNQSRVNVVGSPTIRSAACVPSESSRPTRAVLARGLASELEHARRRRPRVDLVVALEEADVARPGHPRRVLLRRLEADEHRLALAREDARVVPLHPPEVRQVEDVVGRPHDERVELVLGHERANALELRVVARPAHAPILWLDRRFDLS